VEPIKDRQTRYHAIDNLRATMISIVMFGHALLPYVTFPRSFKDPQTHLGFDVVAIFLYGFAMPAFFVTAGFSTALIHHRKGLRGLGRNRLQRIFLPLMVAYLLLSPLTRGAFRFARETAQSGSLQAGLDEILLANWIYWGKPYHLWFLVSLLVYSALAIGLRWGVLRIAGDRKSRLLSASRCLFVSRWRLALFTLAVASMMLPAYVLYGADATTVPMQLALFGFFVFGWLLYLHRDLLPTFQPQPWRPILIVLLVLPLAVWSTRMRLITPEDTPLWVGIVAGMTNSILAAFMTFGLLGIYQARSSRPSALGQFVSDASYWVYLIHYPLVIAAAGVLIVTPFPALIKYLLTLVIVVPIVLASYHFGVRSTPLGRWLSSGKREAGARRP
jgi:peptidoglycan/LPS O-acetylase OafA/YrhL